MIAVLPVSRFPERTLPALLKRTASRVPDRLFARELVADAEPTRYSFRDFEHAVAATAQGLSELGVTAGDRILFIAENSLAWQIVAWAAQALRAETCAAYANLGATALCEIAQRVRPCCIFVANAVQFGHLETVLKDLVCSGLRLRVSPVPLGDAPLGIRDVSTEDLVATPHSEAQWSERVARVAPTDPFLVLFTSGTSGGQKGVILTQDAFVRALEGGQSCTGMTESDDGLMFLPFAHVAGQCQFALAVALGHSLIMVARREDLAKAFALGPTYVFAVPMVYEKLRARAAEGVAKLAWPLRPLLRASLVVMSNPDRAARGSARSRLLLQLGRRTIGKALSSQLGGRLRMVASGGAYAPPDLVQFFESLNIPYLSLYGMTETCGLISSTRFAQARLNDSVGLVSPDLNIRIAEDGELRVKGPMLMHRYLNTEDTPLAFDADGYFRTGDMVQCDPETGQLRIVGRSKDLIVLSTGKKLSPEPLEARLSSIPSVDSALLVGDGRPCVAAVLFVDARRHGDVEKATQDSEQLLTQVRACLHDNAEFERPKRLLVVPHLPSEFPGFMTPTFKIKRGTILEQLSDPIDRLYANDCASVTVLTNAQSLIAAQRRSAS
ncbi:MAG TPA: AMP-binding protein [Polyangiaceae bacterium]|nr:AMP-binding protein [Polyangiaceae bacterium]